MHYVPGDTERDADNGTLNESYSRSVSARKRHGSYKGRAKSTRRASCTTPLRSKAHAEGADVTMQFPGQLQPRIATPKPLHVPKNRCSRRTLRRHRVLLRSFVHAVALTIDPTPTPLAARMRPTTLDEYVGQQDDLGSKGARCDARSKRCRPVDDPVGPAGHRKNHACRDRSRTSPARISNGCLP